VGDEKASYLDHRAMKLGVRLITMKTPRECFGMLAGPIIIEFEDLHALYHQKRLDVQLISVWCL
jgi:hypothetical protein